MATETVVLVDDNEALLEGMKEILRQHALEVIGFREFESARDYLQTHSPSALVTDIRLGAFNGLHLVVLAKQWTPEISAFVYSSYSDTATRTEAARCGAVYVAKDDIFATLLPRLLDATSVVARVR
jgi:DNA-binding NtrC family response regulator